jgi:hypothetical protein
MLPKTLLAIAALLSCFVSRPCLAESLSSQHTALVLHGEIPTYPAVAITAHISGVVQLHVLVEGGAVVKTESNSPPSLLLLGNAATASVKTWRFVPEAHGFFDVTFTFELTKEEEILPSNPHIEMQLPEWVKITARSAKPTCNDCSPDDETAPEAKPKADSVHPDQVLFERAELAVERKRFDVAHIILQTLVNTYPDSDYASKAQLLLKNPRIAQCGGGWTVPASSGCDGEPVTASPPK